MRLVVFDVDGTLVDSQHQIHAAMTEAFADAGLPGPTLAEVHEVIGLSLPVATPRIRSSRPASASRQSRAPGNSGASSRRRFARNDPL